MSKIKKVYLMFLESENREQETQLLKFIESYRGALDVEYIEKMKGGDAE